VEQGLVDVFDIYLSNVQRPYYSISTTR